MKYKHPQVIIASLMIFSLLAVVVFSGEFTGLFIAEPDQTAVLDYSEEGEGYTNQRSFDLDLEEKVFRYEQKQFNDSSRYAVHEWTEEENKTVWINLPRNSTIVNSSIKAVGQMFLNRTEVDSGQHLHEVSIGNVSETQSNEIAVSSYDIDNIYLLDNEMNRLWDKNMGVEDAYTVDIGRVSEDGDEVILVGTDDEISALDGDGEELWNSSTGTIRSLSTGNILGNTEEEVFGVGPNIHTILGYDSELIFNETLDKEAYSADVGVFDSGEEKDEMVVGFEDGDIEAYRYDEDSGELEEVCSFSADNDENIRGVSFLNVTDSSENKIAATDQAGKVYLLDSDCQEEGVFDSMDYEGRDLDTGNLASHLSGEEVLVGSYDGDDGRGRAYVFGSELELLNSFELDERSRGVSIGNVTSMAPGGSNVKEGLVTTMGGSLYELDYDAFPTNLTLQIGGNLTWDYMEGEEVDDGRFRESKVINDTNTNISDAFQEYIDEEEKGDYVEIPATAILFTSDYRGRLNITNLNVTYDYDASPNIYEETVDYWSRTRDITANESIVNQSINISFTDPAVDINISNISVPSDASECGFTDKEYYVEDEYCIVDEFVVDSSDAHEPVYLWHDDLDASYPAMVTKTGFKETEEVNNYTLHRDVEITDETGETDQDFKNITANVSVENDSIVENHFLEVEWDGEWHDITPEEASDCKEEPEYSEVTVEDDEFYVCKQIDDEDEDIFKWKQPELTSSTSYRAGGYTEHEPVLEDKEVVPEEDIWGEDFDFNVNVSDEDGEMVNVTLWVDVNKTGWEETETQVLDSSPEKEELTFTVGSDRDWSGENRFLFEYVNYNEDGDEYYELNSSVEEGPLALKHEVTVSEVHGNETSVNRTKDGTEEAYFEVLVENEDTEEYVEGANVSFWVTEEDDVWDQGYETFTNSSGYANYTFSPDGNYSVGNQSWEAGVFDDDHYKDTNVTEELRVGVHGLLTTRLLKPEDEDVLLRNTESELIAGLEDQYGNKTGEEYDCTFKYDEDIGSDEFVEGECNYTWVPDCDVERGEHDLTVSVEGEEDFYTVLEEQDSIDIEVWDVLDVNVTEPSSGSVKYKNETIDLGYEVGDSCDEVTENYDVDWSLVWKDGIKLEVTEKSGINRTDEPFKVNGTWLEDFGIDLNNWKINDTRVVSGGEEVEMEVRPWVSEDKEELDYEKEYMDNYSDIVFLVDVEAGESEDYWIIWNETNPQPQDTISYIENGGFEGGDLSAWEYTEGTPGSDDYDDFVFIENKSKVGNYSAHIFGYDGTSYLNTTMLRETGSEYLTMKYKAWGTFEDEDREVKIHVGDGVCELNLNYDRLDEEEAEWDVLTCQDESFEQADEVSLQVTYEGTGGYGTEAPHLLVDYICISDSEGECLNRQTGAPTEKEVEFRDNIDGDEEWEPDDDVSVGDRRLYSKVEGDYYKPDFTTRNFDLFGWSNVSEVNLTSDYCTYRDMWVCGEDAEVRFDCNVVDMQSGSGVGGYNFSLYNDTDDESYLKGTNTTLEGGWGYKWFDTSSHGEYTLTCGIDDEPSVFYNASSEDEETLTFSVESGDTDGVLLQDPRHETAENVTRLDNETFDVNLTVKSEGGMMLNPELVVDTEDGIYYEEVYCPPLDDGEVCERTMEVNVTQEAEPGTADLIVDLEWSNSDGTEDSTENSTEIEIEENTELKIVEDEINDSVSAGFEGSLTNFTVEAFGNTDVEGVTLNMTDVSDEELYELTSLEGDLGDIEKGENVTEEINATIPMDIDPGVYTAQIQANATNSTCSPDDKCLDTSLFNLTVDIPDWYSESDFLNKTIGTGDVNGTIGEIEVFNNLDENHSFEVEVSGNGTEGDTDYITVSNKTFEVGNQSSETLQVLHRRYEDNYENGTYFAHVKLSPEGDIVTDHVKFTATLDVVDLTVDVLEPNYVDYSGPLDPGEEINVSANVTRFDEVVEEDVDFDIWIGGEECPITDISGYIDLAGGWVMECEVPEIPENPIRNDIRVAATHEDVTSYGENEEAVIYHDVVPPQFSEVYVDPVHKDEVRDSDRGYKEIEVDITDNTDVDEAWMDIETPEDNITLFDYVRDGDSFTFTLDSSDFDDLDGEEFPVGDYEINVSANDTGQIEDPDYDIGGGLVNSTRGWFDVYETVDISGELTRPTGEYVPGDFTFYRTGEGRDFWPHPIHEFTVDGEDPTFEWETHRRKYDIKAEVFGQEVTFEAFDTDESAMVEDEDPGEISDPFRFDYIPNSSSYDGALRVLSRQFQNPIFGFVVNQKENLTFSGKNITMDFSGKDLGGVENRNNLRVLKCEEWNYSNRHCNETLDEGHYFEEFEPDTEENTISFFDDEMGSAYVLAEACISEGELIDCGGYTPDDPVDTGNGDDGPGPVDEEDPFPFDVDSNIENVEVFPGDERSFWIMITNNLDDELSVEMEATDDLSEWVEFEEDLVELDPTSSRTLGFDLELPTYADPGEYSGDIRLAARDEERTMPMEVNLLEEIEDDLSLDLGLLDDEVERGDNVTFRVELNTESANELDVEATYTARGPENQTLIETEENIAFTGSYSGFREMEIPEDAEAGRYELVVWAEIDEGAVRDMETFHVLETFWATTAGQLLLFLGVPIAVLGIVISGVHLKGKYEAWKEAKEEEKRYLFPVDDNAIPQKSEDSFWIGKLAGSDKNAYYNPDDLKTHVLVAGATGAGKSVGASVFAEEALDQDIPVVVFDPTAQWTGFVNRCEDDELMKYYSKFNMDKRKRKSYPGMIHKMDDPEKDIDFKSLTNEGEITVFTLNDLSTEEFDQAVRNIIDSMFDINWEESEDLKLVVVFDEVHRLLEKYGGKGGYEALERACREFRKWGIGLIMCSQVLADFKQAIEGNVLTDVQFNTKAIKDIRKAKDKYGEKYAKRITRQGIGVCMMQHAQYNDGDPWFVRFRPTWHNPHKLKEEELEKYEDFAEKLDELEERIDEMEDKDEDVFDLRTSLRMAKNKLKTGNFRMTEIYINSLEEKIQ